MNDVVAEQLDNVVFIFFITIVWWIDLPPDKCSADFSDVSPVQDFSSQVRRQNFSDLLDVFRCCLRLICNWSQPARQVDLSQQQLKQRDLFSFNKLICLSGDCSNVNERLFIKSKYSFFSPIILIMFAFQKANICLG